MVGHKYSTDDVVTAWAAGKEARRLLLPPTLLRPAGGADPGSLRGLDLGTGLGSVLLMMCWQFPSNLHYVGIEAQGRNAERARRSCWVNGCEARTEIKHGDIRALFDAAAGAPPVAEGERGFDIVTGAFIGDRDHFFDFIYDEFAHILSLTWTLTDAGTPPYFDAHGAPTPSNPADPPISITVLPSEGNDAVPYNVTRKAASGKARTQPVPLPAAEDQRPCNFELRGG